MVSGWKHGESPEKIRTKEYNIWRIMRQRCNNKNSKGYKHYGARGIRCCERWDDYNKFIEDMGRCPSGYGIERADVNGDYEPSNCSWMPLELQSRNRRWIIEARERGGCKNGHKWTAENMHINPYGSPICRICDRERVAARRDKIRREGK